MSRAKYYKKFDGFLLRSSVCWIRQQQDKLSEVQPSLLPSSNCEASQRGHDRLKVQLQESGQKGEDEKNFDGIEGLSDTTTKLLFKKLNDKPPSCQRHEITQQVFNVRDSLKKHGEHGFNLMVFEPSDQASIVCDLRNFLNKSTPHPNHRQVRGNSGIFQ